MYRNLPKRLQTLGFVPNANNPPGRTRYMLVPDNERFWAVDVEPRKGGCVVYYLAYGPDGRTDYKGAFRNNGSPVANDPEFPDGERILGLLRDGEQYRQS